jgi:hypothetical protein
VFTRSIEGCNAYFSYAFPGGSIEKNEKTDGERQFDVRKVVRQYIKSIMIQDTRVYAFSMVRSFGL